MARKVRILLDPAGNENSNDFVLLPGRKKQRRSDWCAVYFAKHLEMELAGNHGNRVAAILGRGGVVRGGLAMADRLRDAVNRGANLVVRVSTRDDEAALRIGLPLQWEALRTPAEFEGLYMAKAPEDDFLAKLEVPGVIVEVGRPSLGSSEAMKAAVATLARPLADLASRLVEPEQNAATERLKALLRG